MTILPTTHANQRSVYTGRTTSWPMVAATCVGALYLGVVGTEANTTRSDLIFVLPLVLIAVGVVAEILTASSVRASAGPNGFTIRWGFLGWPRCTYRISEIAHAEVIELPWWRVSYGFWWTPKRTNCTVRSGPSVRLTLHNQRIVTITVPEPDAAVAALRDASTDV